MKLEKERARSTNESKLHGFPTRDSNTNKRTEHLSRQQLMFMALPSVLAEALPSASEYGSIAISKKLQLM